MTWVIRKRNSARSARRPVAMRGTAAIPLALAGTIVLAKELLAAVVLAAVVLAAVVLAAVAPAADSPAVAAPATVAPAIAAPATVAPAAAAPAAAAAGVGYGVIESEKGPVLLGEVSRADIVKLFPAWMDTAAAYQPDSSAVAVLHAVDQPVDILCVLGTWCSDSRREVPRFWRVLDATANPNLRLRMLAVGRKDDANAQAMLAELGFAEDIRTAHGVTLIPTFIFRRGEDGTELGRIVETPAEVLEKDTAALLGELALETAPAAPGAVWR